MSESKRTKGEWRPDPLNSLSIVDDTGNAFHGLICQTNGKSREEALANRDFIINAVNNHDKLVEALRKISNSSMGDFQKEGARGVNAAEWAEGLVGIAKEALELINSH